MDILKDINWSIFNEEEKEKLIEAFNNDDYQSLCCLPDVIIDSPEKEREIEKMVLELRDIDLGDESKVREELDKFWQENNEMTPKKEAEWQKKIDEEIKTKEKEVQKQKDDLMTEKIDEVQKQKDIINIINNK
ncbi:MAG: hypothetical protein WC917_00750 [Bacilli bacterium]|jgi:hypothetical protein